jgi:PadR family transcriptional regulator PadR
MAILLALDWPGHGLQIIERIRDRTEGRVRLKERTVHPALRAMERQRLLRSWEVPATGRTRRRRYYELTLKGVAMARTQRDALQALLGKAPDPPTAEEIARMRDRLRRSAEVSSFVLDLRRRMSEQALQKR